MLNRKLLVLYAIIAGISLSLLILWARPYSRFLLTVLPPADLYTPVLRQQIWVSKNDKFQYSSVSHQYSGIYQVGLYFSNPPEFGASIQSNAEIKFQIVQDNTTILERIFTNWRSRIGGSGKPDSGIILGSYKVPEEVPLKVNTTVIITITVSDATFEDKYGVVELFVRRISDQ